MATWNVTVGIFGKRDRVTEETWTVLGADATQAGDRAMSDLDKPWYKSPRGFVKTIRQVTP